MLLCSKKSIWAGLVILVVIAILLFLKLFSPDMVDYYPPCPFKTLTGYACPGCGAQRALHHLLNFDLAAAFMANALLVISIPYLFVGFLLDLVKNPSQRMMRWKRILYGKRAIYIVLTIIIGYWIARNIFVC